KRQMLVAATVSADTAIRPILSLSGYSSKSVLGHSSSAGQMLFSSSGSLAGRGLSVGLGASLGRGGSGGRGASAGRGAILGFHFCSFGSLMVLPRSLLNLKHNIGSLTYPLWLINHHS